MSHGLPQHPSEFRPQARLRKPQLAETPITPEQTLCHPRSYPWCVLFDSISPFFLYFSFLSFSVYFLHNELFLELLYTKVMANLRCSAAEESEDTLNAFNSLTGYETNLLTFGELNDSSVPFSFMIPSSDQDVDDVTLGKMLTETHPRTSRLLRTRRHVSQSVVVVCNVRWIRAT